MYGQGTLLLPSSIYLRQNDCKAKHSKYSISREVFLLHDVTARQIWQGFIDSISGPKQEPWGTPQVPSLIPDHRRGINLNNLCSISRHSLFWIFSLLLDIVVFLVSEELQILWPMRRRAENAKEERERKGEEEGEKRERRRREKVPVSFLSTQRLRAG